MTDLDAIRARDAGYSDGFMADDSHPMLQVMRDRRALLAEVDRLRAVVDAARCEADETDVPFPRLREALARLDLT